MLGKWYGHWFVFKGLGTGRDCSLRDDSCIGAAKPDSFLLPSGFVFEPGKYLLLDWRFEDFIDQTVFDCLV